MSTGGNVLLTSLLHAAQSFFVIVNEGIPLAELVWPMAAVYLAMAFIIVIFAGSSFVRRPVAAILPTVEAASTNQAVAGK